jgi:hypothetical protein
MHVFIRIRRAGPRAVKWHTGGLVLRDGNVWRNVDSGLPVEHIQVMNWSPKAALAMILGTKAKKEFMKDGADKATAELLVLKELIDMATLAAVWPEFTILEPKPDGGYNVIREGKL